MSHRQASREGQGLAQVCSAAMLTLVLGCAEEAAAEVLVGLTSTGSLVSFDSATPGTVNPIGAISGLTAGDAVVGIDRRPSLGVNDGTLYGVGVNSGTGSGRIYVLSDADASATLVSTLTADPFDVSSPYTSVVGTAFGVDFDPVSERLRLSSNSGQNLRINVDNGLVVTDAALAYGAMDANAGDAPVVVALAYSNNTGGAMSTTLQGVDIGQSPDNLVGFASPNAGTLASSANLPFDSTDLTAFDISGLTGTPYFAVTAAMATSSELWASGPGGVALVGTIGGGATIRGLAAYPFVDTPTPTGTPTTTSTATATATATNTPLRDLGDTCSSGTQCQSSFCVGQVCCDAVCDDAGQTCRAPGREGTCLPLDPAPAPSASPVALWMGLALLILVAAMRLRARRPG